MGFDFDCVLCSLLMFIRFFYTGNHTFYETQNLDHMLHSLLHLTMVSRLKRYVIGLCMMSFKKVSAFIVPRLFLLAHFQGIFVWPLPSIHPEERRRQQILYQISFNQSQWNFSVSVDFPFPFFAFGLVWFGLVCIATQTENLYVGHNNLDALHNENGKCNNFSI